MNPNEIYAICSDKTRCKVIDKDGVESTTHHNIETDYYLPNLDEYLLKDTVWEKNRIAAISKYDSVFAAKLCDYRCEYHKNETPFYEYIPEFLDFHYKEAKNRNAFLNHVKYVILSDYIHDFRDMPAGYLDLINQWLDQKVIIKTRYKSFGRSVMFCLRLLQDRGDHSFTNEREKVIEFIESNFMHPDKNKAPNGRSIYNAHRDILNNDDISDIIAEHKSDFKAGEEYSEKFI